MNILKKFVLLVTLSMISNFGFSQVAVEFRPIAGYTIQETFPVNYGNVRVYGNGTYGFALAAIIQKSLDINFSYQIQPTTMDILVKPISDKNIDIDVSSYQLGFNRNLILPNEKIIPYAGIRLGAISLTDHSGRYTSATKFGLGLNLGVKIMINDKIGINLYSLLQSPVQGAGLFIGVGSGGVSTGVSTYSYIYQLSFGGGLVFVLKK
jgi:hypothetical protein